MSFAALPHNYLTWDPVTTPLTEFIRYNVLRRENGQTSWTRLKVITDRTLTFYQDYTAESDTLYEYAVTQTKMVGTEELDSNVPTPVTAQLTITSFFLHDTAAPENYVELKARALQVAPDQEVQYVLPWGRRRPTAHIGNKNTSALSFDVYRSWQDELEEAWEALTNLQQRQRDNGAVICARQQLGVRFFTQIEKIGRDHRVGQLTRVSVQLREVNYDEEV